MLFDLAIYEQSFRQLWQICVKSQPLKPENVTQSLFRLSSPSGVNIARNERQDHRGYSIRRHRVRLRLTSAFITAKSFTRAEVLRGGLSCLSSDVFSSSSPPVEVGEFVR